MAGALSGAADERGTELVEFALVLPLLMLVLGGIVDFGFLFQRYQVLTNAAREGARLATLGYACGDVKARIASYVDAGLGAGASSLVTVAGSEQTVGTGGAGYRVARVQAQLPSANFILGPFMRWFGGSPTSSVLLTAVSTMRVEVIRNAATAWSCS